MKKNLIFFSAATLISLLLALVTKEGFIYFTALLMAGIIIVAVRYFRSADRKITRWAKTNPRKAQVFITITQVIILSLGLVVGYDLMQLGYKVSDEAVLVFGVMMVIGFSSVRFLPKKNRIALPLNLFKERIAYTFIIIAAFALTVITGNRIEDKYPDSILTTTLRSIDQKIFPEDNVTESSESFGEAGVDSSLEGGGTFVISSFASSTANDPAVSKKEARANAKEVKKAMKLEKKQKRMSKRIEKLRKMFAAGASTGTVLLIILLILTLCAGVCLIVGGFSGGGAAAVIFGVLIAAGSIYGIVKVSKKSKKEREREQKIADEEKKASSQ